MRRPLIMALATFTALPALALAQPTPAEPAATPPPAQQWKHHGGWNQRHDPMMLLDKFYAANTTHDGHLTLAQAKAADMKHIADNFNAIDTKHRGYVTLYDIQAWRMDTIAQRLEQRADQLRAKD